MASNYALATQCQLRRDELGELLALAVTVESHSMAMSSASDDKSSSDSPDRNWALSLWQMFLTGAHIRSLVERVLVRVSIPKSKQQLLIHENDHIRSMAQSANVKEGKQQHYRLGSVVAIVPHPRVASDKQESTDCGCAVTQLSNCLLQIDFGDVAELLGAKYVSNEPFTVEEHTVYVRSRVTNCINSNTPLLSTSHMEIVARNVRDIQKFVEAIRTGRKGIEGDPLKHSTGDADARVTKRPRSDMNAIGDGIVSDDNGEVTHRRMDNMCNSNECAQRKRLVDDQERRLISLRQHLNNKNTELQRLLEAQRRTETDHNAQREQWNAKSEALGVAIRRAEKDLAEERTRQQEHHEKTQKLITQMKRLAEQTRKFKDVSDAVAEWLSVASRQPEEVLARVREKIAEGKS